MAGDPPLDQVVTQNVGRRWPRAVTAGVSWNAGVFHAANHDDILFVTSEQTGFGYFRNFGQTRRAGLELGANGRFGRVTYGAGYTFLDATFESEETVNGESNSSNDAAESGDPGLEGTIEIEPGDRMPLIPRHMFKAYADLQATSRAVARPASHRASRAPSLAATRTTATRRMGSSTSAPARHPATPS